MPILNYIFNELDATKPVSRYINIVTLIKSESAKSNSNLLKEIVNMLLEDNQEAAEYEFAQYNMGISLNTLKQQKLKINLKLLIKI